VNIAVAHPRPQLDKVELLHISRHLERRMPRDLTLTPRLVIAHGSSSESLADPCSTPVSAAAAAAA
jgi:hypothetical protein